MDSVGDTLAGGLPHSEIPGSTIARISPGLIAACHALHRLSVPRHPPDALTSLLPGTPLARCPANPPLTGTKTNPASDASREDTLPQRRTNSSQPSAISCQLENQDTRLGHTLFTLSKNTAEGHRPPANGNSHDRRDAPSTFPPASPHREPSARGGGERDRTDDLLLAKQALSQLSYTPR
jgi:hypothetical protein